MEAWLPVFEKEQKVAQALESLAKTLAEYDRNAAIAYELAMAASMKYSRAIALAKNYDEEALVVRAAGRSILECAVKKCMEILNILL